MHAWWCWSRVFNRMLHVYNKADSKKRLFKNNRNASNELVVNRNTCHSYNNYLEIWNAIIGVFCVWRWSAFSVKSRPAFFDHQQALYRLFGVKFSKKYSNSLDVDSSNCLDRNVLIKIFKNCWSTALAFVSLCGVFVCHIILSRLNSNEEADKLLLNSVKLSSVLGINVRMTFKGYVKSSTIVRSDRENMTAC